jgi:hypothetical protein
MPPLPPAAAIVIELLAVLTVTPAPPVIDTVPVSPFKICT